MKISAKQYARSLFEIIKNADDGQIEKIIRDFTKVLIKNNDAAKIEKIIRHFNEFWNKDKGVIEAEIISAKELGKDISKLLEDHIKKLTGGKVLNLKKKIEKDILGGVVIKYGDKVLDSSLKTKLRQFSNILKS